MVPKASSFSKELVLKSDSLLDGIFSYNIYVKGGKVQFLCYKKYLHVNNGVREVSIVRKFLSTEWEHMLTLNIYLKKRFSLQEKHRCFQICWIEKKNDVSRKQNFRRIIPFKWFSTSHKDRSSHPEEFCKKGVLWNFAKFTGKHLCQRPATLLKRDSGRYTNSRLQLDYWVVQVHPKYCMNSWNYFEKSAIVPLFTTPQNSSTSSKSVSWR